MVDVYIDDFFGAATVEEAPFVYNRLLFLLRELGLEISPENCFEPSTRMVCLGIIFDTELLIISVPEDKIVKLKEELCTLLSRLTFTKRQLQSLLGKLSYQYSLRSTRENFYEQVVKCFEILYVMQATFTSHHGDEKRYSLVVTIFRSV